MDISPLDIQKKEFSKSIRGYKIEEVDQYLEKLLESYERIYKENKDLKEKMQALEEKLENYKTVESTLKNTLILAEKTAEEVKHNAQKERDAILKSASLQAEKMLQQAEQKCAKISNRCEELRQQFYLYKTRFKNFLQSQLDYLDSTELDIFDNTQELAKLEAAAADDTILSEDKVDIDAGSNNSTAE